MMEIKIDIDSWEVTSLVESLLKQNNEIFLKAFAPIEVQFQEILNSKLDKLIEDKVYRIAFDMVETRARNYVDNYLNCPVYGCTLKSIVNKHLDSVLEEHIKNAVDKRLKRITDKILKESDNA